MKYEGLIRTRLGKGSFKLGSDLSESSLPNRLRGVDGHDSGHPGGLVAGGLGSNDAVPHEVQRRRGTQGLLVQRKTIASQPSVNAAEQLTMTGGEVGGEGEGLVKERCEVSHGLFGSRKERHKRLEGEKKKNKEGTAVVTVDMEPFVRPRSPLRRTGLRGNKVYTYVCNHLRIHATFRHCQISQHILISGLIRVELHLPCS